MSHQNVTTQPYAWLRRANHTPRPHIVLSRFSELPPHGNALVGVDLETKGTDPTAPDGAIVGVGLASAAGVFYCPISRWSEEDVIALWEWLLDRPQLISHNVGFDGAWLWEYTGEWLNWEACTLILFKLLANEGWKGQRWKLGIAQTDILGWDTSNKETLEMLLTKHGLTRAEMWKLDELEFEAFAEYCAQDAEACYQLYNELTLQMQEHEWASGIWQWLRRFMIQVRRIAEQQLRGLEVNVPGTQTHQQALATRAQELSDQFYAHPQVAQHIAAYNAAVVDEVRQREPRKRNLHAEHEAKEPPRMTKSGKSSARWDAWYRKKAEVDAAPKYNAQWCAWKERLLVAECTQHFNINSRDQLCWLFFEKLRCESIKTTESGDDGLDNKVLPTLGEAGLLVLRYRKVLKEDGYVRACLEFTRDGVFRPTIRSHGTITGRIAGGMG